MKILIILEKYGGFCNRLFQSIHYHAYAIDKEIKFLNPTIFGLLKFDNCFFYFFDKLHNIFLKCISKFITLIIKKDNIIFYINKNNYIKIVKGWNFRKNHLTTKYHKKIKEFYRFNTNSISKKSLLLINSIDELKNQGKFIVGLHVRRGDYKLWNDGKYYFSDEFYKKVINDLKMKLINDNFDPFFILVSDEKFKSNIGMDLITNGSWKHDQITLQSCDLILGPPSTFSMWASFLCKIPLLQLKSKENIDLDNWIICDG